MKKVELTKYLNDYLNVDEYDDDSHNWLQVDNSKDNIEKIAIAVDASSYNIDQAIERQVDAMIVHHGLLWGFEKPVKGLYYKNLSKLIKADIALYGYHLPLDVHEEVWNNKWLTDWLINVCGIKDYEILEFGNYNDHVIGCGVRFENKLALSSVVNKFLDNFSLQKKFYNYGDLEYVNSIAVVSGGAGGLVESAHSQGYDLFITGEFKHSEYVQSKQLGQSIVQAWHRETEKIGVKLLANKLKNEFGIDNTFVDQWLSQH